MYFSIQCKMMLYVIIILFLRFTCFRCQELLTTDLGRCENQSNVRAENEKLRSVIYDLQKEREIQDSRITLLENETSKLATMYNDSVQSISRSRQELENMIMENLNVTFTRLSERLVSYEAKLQQTDRIFYSNFSEVYEWISNMTGNLQNLEQVSARSTISIENLHSRIIRLEDNNNDVSTISKMHRWVANLKNGYKQIVRLVNGTANYGRLEVHIDGKGWGTVCDDSFNLTDAFVVCRQLGYSYGVGMGSAFFGQGTLPIIMDDVSCVGSEWAIQNCRYSRTHDCNHGEDVGVICM